MRRFGFIKKLFKKFSTSDGDHKDDPFIAGGLGKLMGRSDIQPCLVYCSLYPKGRTIVREEVVNEWMALGFLQTEGGGDEQDVGNHYFREMLAEGVFQDLVFAYGGTPSDEDAVIYSCVMCPLAHDAVSHLANQPVFSEYGHHCKLIDLVKFITFDSSHGDPLIVSDLSGESRRSLLTLKEELSVAPVLKIRGAEVRMQLHSLMRDSLYNLRYLGLSECINKDIELLFPVDFVVGIKNLQTLALDHTLSLHEDEWTSLLNSKKLKGMMHLYITTVAKTLRFKGMSALRILELSHCNCLETLHEKDAKKLTNLRVLRFFNCPLLLCLPTQLQLLEELVIHNCPRLNLTAITAMDAFPSLRYMEIIGVHSMFQLPKGLMSATALRYLMIADCKRLRRLTNAMLYLTSLEKLRIYRCPKLEALPVEMVSLTNLKSLHIQQCRALTASYTKTSHQWASISHIPDLIVDAPERIHKEPQNMPISSTEEKSGYRQADHYVKEKPKTSTKDSSETSGPRVDCYVNEMSETSIKDSSETSGYVVPQTVPYFKLKSSMSPGGSQGVVEEQHEIQNISRWDIIGPVFRAVFRMKAIVRETSTRRQRRKQRLRQRLLKESKLFSCQFPFDYEFEKDTIVQLWMAGGSLSTAPNELITSQNQHIEDVGSLYFDLIIEDEFFKPSSIDCLSGKQKFVLNPDKVEAFLAEMPIVERKNLYEPADGSSKSWHIILASDNIDHTTFETLKCFRELKTLLFIRDYGPSLTKVPSEMFLAHPELQSLDLSGSHISELPSSIGYLKRLHYLDLSFTLIEELPESLGWVRELQTLKLRGCKRLFSLPNCMQSLITLRHLDFDVLGQLTSMPCGLGALTELQTLSAFIVSEQKGCLIEELKELNNLTGRFCISGLENVVQNAKNAALQKKTRLTHLELRWNCEMSNNEKDQCDPPESIMGDLEPHSCLEELQVLCFPGSSLRNWIGNSEFTKLVSVRLLKCENLTLHLTLGELPSLKYLDITEMNNVKKIDKVFRGASSSDVAFPKLDTLMIDTMLGLITWRYVYDHDFPVLSKLTIRSCPKLSELPFHSLPASLEHLEISDCTEIKSIPNRKPSSRLKIVTIEDCPLLKEKCSRNGEDWHKIEHAESVWIDLKNMHSPTNSTESGSDSELENGYWQN